MRNYLMLALLSMGLLVGCANGTGTSSTANTSTPSEIAEAQKCSSYAPCAKACNDTYTCGTWADINLCTSYLKNCLNAALPSGASAKLQNSLQDMALISQKPSWYRDGQVESKDYEYDAESKIVQICDTENECAVFIKFQ